MKDSYRTAWDATIAEWAGTRTDPSHTKAVKTVAEKESNMKDANKTGAVRKCVGIMTIYRVMA